jgi:transcriptional regulator with XRE-family HTH domain
VSSRKEKILVKYLELFAIKLRELRQTKGVRQVDIAKLLAVTEQHYQRIEYGKVDLPTSKLITLADYFDCSLDEFVGRSLNKGEETNENH